MIAASVSRYAMRKDRPETVTAPESFSLAPGMDRAALDQLFSAAYEELRRLASVVKAGDPAATLNPTALVHEAWIKLAKSPGFACSSAVHFKRVAARAMRQLLVESARRRQANKRDSGGQMLSLDGAEGRQISLREDELVRLDAALDDLARFDPRQAAIVEGRFFGGLESGEIADLLEISEATVLRDWRAAKAWLAQATRRE